MAPRETASEKPGRRRGDGLQESGPAPGGTGPARERSSNDQRYKDLIRPQLWGSTEIGPQTQATPDPAPPPVPSYRDMSVGAGTSLRVSLDQELSTETSNVGDKFTVTVLDPVMAEGGVVIPAGTKIQGEVTALEPSGGAGQQAMIRLDFGQLLLDGESHRVAMTVAEANPTTKGRKSTEEKAVTIGAGAAVGAILGRVIGGNATGTIVGGVAGAAAGTAIALGTEDVDALLEAGSEMTLRVEERITVRRPA